MDVVIVTGLSGAGKSKVKDYFEDMGYYSIDNMPPSLIKSFIELTKSANNTVDKACFVLDLRGGEFFKDFKKVLKELKDENDLNIKLIFVEASNDVLVRRYSEVRRTHPLSSIGLSLEKTIEKEIELLKPIKKDADYIIDTSKIKSSKLKESLDIILGDGKLDKTFTLNFMSFGYKYGLPMEADWVLDARFIPNPFYVLELKSKTGLDKEVRDYVLDKKQTRDFINDISLEIETLIPFYISEGKNSLTIAIGCTGGQHRSVCLAKALYDKFYTDGYITTLEHRDL